MAKPNFTLPNKPAIKSGSILSYNYTDDFTFVPAPLTFNRDSAATRVNEKGLIEEILIDKPRIDYSDSLTEPSLLLEPQSTNKLTYSEDFSQYITTSGVTLTSNYGISPDGTQNSTRLQLSTNNEQMYKSIIHSGNTETASLFVKGTSGETIQFGVGNNISQGQTYTLNGQWQRIQQQSTSGSVFIIGNKDLTATDFEIWGAQLEELPYATSYIPTAGSTATRLGETATNAGDVNVFNSEEGVLYAEIAALADNETNREITLSDGTIDNYVLIRFNSGGSNRIYTRVDVNTSIQYFELNTSYNITNYNKIAIRFKNSDFATFINGTKVDFQLSGNSFPSNTLNKLNFDNGGGYNEFHGKVKNVQVFNKALTDRELEILTIQ